MLIFLGLPANVANGTNRIAILMQSLVATGSFKHQKILNAKEGLRLAIPATVGSAAGAFLAVDLDEAAVKKFIAGLLIVMFFLILLKPSAWIQGKAGAKESLKPGNFWQYPIFFAVGFYGGFIQAGVGLFLLAGLVLGAGCDLLKANALKNFIVLFFTVVALGIFIYNGQVDFKIGLILAFGNMIGAFVASKFAVKKGADFVRYIVLIILPLSALKLIFDLIYQ